MKSLKQNTYYVILLSNHCMSLTVFVISAAEATVGCTSNTECSLKESCINRLCISPCNCGPNAECRVTNHYAICFCRPGYSGNPQIGCVKREYSSLLILFRVVFMFFLLFLYKIAVFRLGFLYLKLNMLTVMLDSLFL